MNNKLKDLVVTKTIQNNIGKNCKANLFSLSREEVQDNQIQATKASGYAVANGEWLIDGNIYSWLRSGTSNNSYYAYYLYPSGASINDYNVYDSIAVRPALYLNLPSKISAPRADGSSEARVGNHKVEIFENGGKHYIKVFSLQVPQTLVSKPKELEKTDKVCSGRYDADAKTMIKNPVYISNGERYVEFTAKTEDNKLITIDGVKVETGDTAYAKLVPLVLEIVNWDNLPTSVNPQGNGKDKEIFAVAERGYYQVPFNEECSDGNDYAKAYIHKVEEKLLDEMFYEEEMVSEEVSEETNEPNFKEQLEASMSGDVCLLDKVKRLGVLDATLFEKDSESMNIIAEVITSLMASESDKYYAEAESNDRIAKIDEDMRLIMEEYKKIVTAKREEFAKIKALSEARGAASSKTKAALSDLKKFKRQQFPQGDRVHMDRHSFHSEEQE